MDQSISEFLAREGLGSGVALDGAAEAAKTQVGHHAVGDVVARGGMGAILSARDQNIRRRVAMKVLLDRDPARKEQLVRFIEEAQVTGQLEHPNIVPVHELGIDGENNPYYTMKFIQGGSLKDILARLHDGDAATLAKYPLPKLLGIFLKACDALAFAHSKGVIHRDLKPENLMVGDYGEVLVVDWGLAKVVGIGRPAGPLAQSQISDLKSQISNAISSARQEGGVCVTMDGQVLGTPQYMAPEQATGQIDKLDARTDVYALGGILYSLLTLHPPVEGDTLYQVLLKVSQGEITHPSLYNPGQSLGVARASGADGPGLQTQLRRQVAAQVRRQVTGAAATDPKPKVESPKPLLHLPGGRVPEPLAAVALRALALDPAARYQTVAELQAEVEAYLGGYATQAEDASLWRQLGLLVKRNKGIFTTAAAGVLVVMLTVGFAFVGVNRQRAAAVVARNDALAAKAAAETAREQTLTVSRQAAPEFVAKADGFLRAWDKEGAWATAVTATELDPANADAWLARGRAALLRRELTAAQAAFAKAEGLGGSPEQVRQAKTYTAFVAQRLKPRKPGAGTNAAALGMALQDPIVAKLLEYDGVAEDLLAMAKTMLLNENPGLTPADVTFVRGTEGLRLALPIKPVTSIKALAGLPLVSLDLSDTKVTDLTPLAGVPLTSLWLARTRVADLAPLRGMKLVTLDVTATAVTNLSPLKGMPLSFLLLAGTRVLDLAPLAGMQLTELSFPWGSTSDLSILKGMPLTTLSMESWRLTDLAPLKGLPLTSLALANVPVKDLTPLAGMQLKWLGLNNTQVADLSPLRGMPLFSMHLEGTKVKDLSPLKGAPLGRLYLWNTPVADLGPLTGMRLTGLSVGATAVSDLSPLTGMKLTSLNMVRAQVTDLTPLAGMPLTELWFSPERIVRGLEVVRAMPTLKAIGTEDVGQLRPAAEFWKEWDARKK